jgi:hypothetical protein
MNGKRTLHIDGSVSCSAIATQEKWVPAFAGMTKWGGLLYILKIL